MFSVRLVAYATMFLALVPSSGLAAPDFDVLEIDVDWQLASLPPPPDLEPISTSAVLDIASPPRALKERSTYLPAIAEEATANGVPPALVDAVVRIESRYDPSAVGSIGEIGLMQVRPKTAALLGFQGTAAELAEPRTNLRYGVGYLAKAWRLADGDLCRALMKYRAGHGSDAMSALSIEYCRRARQHLAAVGTEIGSPAWELAQAGIRPRSKQVERTRLAERLVTAGTAPRFNPANGLRLSRRHEAARVNRAWTNKNRVGELVRQKTRLARIVHRTSSRMIHRRLAAPKSWVASR
ncbi:transglycosylase SLT domain-containing protein (plasmid) [Microvirga terrae]|uniref:Transglycosylase SLT domain-containing protein n=1 Tax=Microvirga terrae TaxID=2740529 RepID=A0ABY5RZ20_9HYPH|nr:transglycosylase SLT domain-containing protein [Microvirga terrae]UVF22501.1 transglycosylase SLT domain-containing protein [Microvirga terrae]